MDQKRLLIKRLAKNLLDQVQKLNRGASELMADNTDSRHKQRIDHQVSYNTGICDKEVFNKLRFVASTPGSDNTLEMARLHFELYLFEKLGSKKGVNYSRADMSPKAKKVEVRGYSFSKPEERANGFYLSNSNCIWMCKLTEFIVEEYEENFQSQIQDVEEHDERLLKALKQFPREYMEVRGMSQELPRYVKTFIHEYLHLVMDELSVEDIDQTIDEAFTWFCSYKVLGSLPQSDYTDFEDAAESIPPSRTYNEPDKIREYARKLNERYRESESENFVSWIIENQKIVAESPRTDERAFRTTVLVPEEFKQDFKEFEELLNRLQGEIRRLQNVIREYSHLENFTNIRKLMEELEYLKLENFEDEVDHLKNDDNMEQMKGDFQQIMREEVERSREIGEDLIALENKLEKLDKVDEEHVQRAKKQIQEKENPKVRRGDNVYDLIWDLLVVSDEIRSFLQKTHELSQKYR